jgi:8-oxo-dGTP pyrophosphatase MutT (NUDIX family)
MAAGGSSTPAAPPAAPKPASTVVLLRDAAAGLEVLLVQRHGGMGFMGGMHVFPGGKVSTTDALEAMRERTHDRGACIAAHVWGQDVGAADSFARAVAAVRETFEEACLLLAALPAACDLPALRAELLAGAELGALLEREGASLKLTELQPLSRWITPESEPVRFDTSFYLARAPEGQASAHDQTEAIASEWLTPAAAMQAATEGRIRLAPPTARTLEGLLEMPDVDAALGNARLRPPPIILPILRMLDGAMVVLYPGDPEHPVRERALPGDTRVVWRRRA